MGGLCVCLCVKCLWPRATTSVEMNRNGPSEDTVGSNGLVLPDWFSAPAKQSTGEAKSTPPCPLMHKGQMNTGQKELPKN